AGPFHHVLLTWPPIAAVSWPTCWLSRVNVCPSCCSWPISAPIVDTVPPFVVARIRLVPAPRAGRNAFAIGKRRLLGRRCGYDAPLPRVPLPPFAGAAAAAAAAVFVLAFVLARATAGGAA